MNALERDTLLAAAREMCELLRKWSFLGTPQIFEDNGSGSVFSMQYAALRKVLGHLGVDDTMGFYEAVIAGSTPEQALRRFGRTV